MFKEIIAESRKLVEADVKRIPTSQLKATTDVFGSDDSKRAQILTRSLRKKGSTVQGVTHLPPRVASAQGKPSVPAPPPAAFKKKPAVPPPPPAAAFAPRKPKPPQAEAREPGKFMLKKKGKKMAQAVKAAKKPLPRPKR